MSELSFTPRLLVVDDDPAFARFVQRAAESCGFTVATSDACTCRERVSSWRPDVVTLDLNMPSMDGVEVLRHLATDRCTAEILLVSGAVDRRTLESAGRLGAERGLSIAGIVRKPIRASELQDLLKAATGPALTASEVAEAIAGDQLFLEYQPKLDCRLGQITAAEALVRWRHPRHGILGPDRFLPTAERADLMGALTGWVAANAIDAAALYQRDAVPVEIAVNMSAKNLYDIEFPDRLVQHCDNAGVATDRLMLELTESHAMADPVRGMDVLTRLRVKGFKLSMDDFGTGYSSLVQLHRMPFSELKVDRSFVAGLVTDKECRDICETIIMLAHKLGLRCIAEGVESEQILNAVIDMGCDGAQGHYLSRALPGDELVGFIRKYNSSARG